MGFLAYRYLHHCPLLEVCLLQITILENLLRHQSVCMCQQYSQWWRQLLPPQLRVLLLGQLTKSDEWHFSQPRPQAPPSFSSLAASCNQNGAGLGTRLVSWLTSQTDNVVQRSTHLIINNIPLSAVLSSFLKSAISISSVTCLASQAKINTSLKLHGKQKSGNVKKDPLYK